MKIKGKIFDKTVGTWIDIGYIPDVANFDDFMVRLNVLNKNIGYSYRFYNMDGKFIAASKCYGCELCLDKK